MLLASETMIDEGSAVMQAYTRAQLPLETTARPYVSRIQPIRVLQLQTKT